MSTPRKHTNYTLEEIAQYLQGSMTPAEMHEFEKAALQDPFLADAIDGFHSAPLPLVKADLEAINTKFSGGAAKVVTTAAKTIVWWKAAAAAVVITAAAVTGWKIWLDKNEPRLITAQKTIKAPNIDSPKINTAAAPGKKEASDMVMAPGQSFAATANHPTSNNHPAEIVSKQPAGITVMATPAANKNPETDTLQWHEAIANAPLPKAKTVTTYGTLSMPGEQLNARIDSTTASAKLPGEFVNRSYIANNNLSVVGVTTVPTRATYNNAAGNIAVQATQPGNVPGKINQALQHINATDLNQKPVQVAATAGGVLLATSATAYTATDILMPGAKNPNTVPGKNNAVSPDKTISLANPLFREKQSANTQQTRDSIAWVSSAFPNPAGNRARKTSLGQWSNAEDTAVLSRQAALDLLKRKPGINNVAAYKDTTSYLLVMEENVLNPEYGWAEFKKYFHATVFAGFGDIQGKMGRVVVTMRLDKRGKVIYADVPITLGLKSFDSILKQRAIKAFKNGPRWTIDGVFQAGNVATHIDL